MRYCSSSDFVEKFPSKLADSNKKVAKKRLGPRPPDSARCGIYFQRAGFTFSERDLLSASGRWRDLLLARSTFMEGSTFNESAGREYLLSRRNLYLLSTRVTTFKAIYF